MENEEVYKKEVEEGSLIRYEINEDHAPVLSFLYRLYKGLFNRNPSEFRAAKDAKYYRGGWPSPNTPPRAKSVADRIADVYSVLSFAGESSDLEMYLRDRGLKLIPIDDSTYFNDFLLSDIEWKLDKKRTKMVEAAWSYLFGDDKMPDDYKEIIKRMLDAACIKQQVICDLADQIKLEKGKKVEEECSVKVSDYTRAVYLKYKIQKGKDVSKDIEKIIENADSTVESIEVLTGDSYQSEDTKTKISNGGDSTEESSISVKQKI